MNVDEHIKQLTEKLDNYERSLGITNVIVPSNISDIINLPEDRLKVMSAEELGENSYRLQQFSFSLCKELNRQKTIISWANRAIDYLLCSKYDEYGGQYTPAATRKMWAIKDNEVTEKIYKILVDSEQKVLSLDGMPERIESMSYRLNQLQQSRRKQNV